MLCKSLVKSGDAVTQLWSGAAMTVMYASQIGSGIFMNDVFGRDGEEVQARGTVRTLFCLCLLKVSLTFEALLACKYSSHKNNQRGGRRAPTKKNQSKQQERG